MLSVRRRATGLISNLPDRFCSKIKPRTAMGDMKAPLLGAGVLPVTNPKDVASHHQTLIDSVAARKSYSYEWRKRNLLELRRCLEENQEELQAAIKKDLNKAFVDSYWSEFNHVYQEIQDCLDNLRLCAPKNRCVLSLPKKKKPRCDVVEAVSARPRIWVAAWVMLNSKCS